MARVNRNAGAGKARPANLKHGSTASQVVAQLFGSWWSLLRLMVFVTIIIVLAWLLRMTITIGPVSITSG